MPNSPTVSSPGRILLLANLSVLLGSLDTSVNIAFPAISAAFDLDVTEIQWVIVCYVLTYASLMLGCGRLADAWGHGRMLTWGLVGNAAAFLLCGLSPNFPLFLAARVLQGVAVALVFASAPALVTLAAPAELRGRSLGLYQMSMAAGFALGPSLGGVLVAGFDWRAVFLYRIIPALILAGLAAGHPRHARGSERGRDLDLVGVFTLVLSVAGLLLAVSRGRHLGWGSPVMVGLYFGTCVSFAAFLATELRVESPVIDLGLFRRPPFSLANLLNLLANGAMFTVWLLVPYYVVGVLECPAYLGGILLVPFPLATALASPLAGRLSDRFGTGRLCAIGLGLEAVGLWAVSRCDAGSGLLEVVAALTVVGVGLGVFQAPNMSYVMGAISRAQQGVAGGMTQTMRTLGVVLSVTGASTLFDVRRAVHTAGLSVASESALAGFVPAFQDVFGVAAAICALAFGMSLLRGRD